MGHNVRRAVSRVQSDSATRFELRLSPEVVEVKAPNWFPSLSFLRLSAWTVTELKEPPFNFTHPDIVAGPLESEKLKEQGLIPANSYNAEYDTERNIIRFGTDWKNEAWKGYVYPGVETELDVVVATLCHEINHAVLLQLIGYHASWAMDTITYDTVWDGGTRI